MGTHAEIVTVDASDVGQYGFFCYKSKRKSVGYGRKLAWLKQRFAEGLRIKIVREGKRSVGFLEYIPGRYAWRAIEASGYLVVHCIWVVGRAKGKGYGSLLLGECLQDALEMGQRGVAMVTSSGNWLASSTLLLRNGFEVVDRALPRFELLVKRLGDSPVPAFPLDWEQRVERCGSGLTVFHSDQCPYLQSAVGVALEAAAEARVEARVVQLRSAEDVRALSPSPYGVFSLIYDGELLSYHLLGRKELLRRLGESTA